MKRTIKVEGMHCASCVTLIREAIDDIDGVKGITIKRGEVTVECRDERTLGLIKDAIIGEGYGVR